MKKLPSKTKTTKSKTTKKMSETATAEAPVKHETKSAATKKPGKAAKSEKPAADKSKKEINDEMAKNAAIIQAGKAKVEVVPPVVIEVSKRPLNEIQQEWLTYNDGMTGVTVKEGMPVEEWSAALKAMVQSQEHIGFWIGDVLNYGLTHYGEKYAAAVEATGYSSNTLKKFVYVALHVKPEVRRPELTFTHHEKVSALTPAKQKRFLAKATSEHLSASALDAKIKELGKSEDKATEGTVTSANAPASGRIFETGSELTGTELELTGDAPAAKAVHGKVVEKKEVSSEDRIKNDEAIEKCDSVQSYFRSAAFVAMISEAKANGGDLKPWLAILKPFAEMYETLLDKVG